MLEKRDPAAVAGVLMHIRRFILEQIVPVEMHECF